MLISGTYNISVEACLPDTDSYLDYYQNKPDSVRSFTTRNYPSCRSNRSTKFLCHYTSLLYALISARPELLSENYELVLYADERFDRSLARLLLNGDKIADEVFISILNWLWEKDEDQLSEGSLLSQQALTRFSGKLTNDRQKQALLIQCLKDGRASPAFIRSVLQTFRHHDYAAFLIERNHRSIVYSDAMWDLAGQLAGNEFIRPPKPTHENTRIRIEPFSHAEEEYNERR
jgi:hypothetical protein